jgi:uncharacterized membrane protein HdeD (DUF308 family)
MTDANISPSLGSSAKRLRSKWPWFIALGVGFLVAGGVASANLMAASLASIVLIGAMMLAGAGMAIVQIFTVPGWQQRLLHGLAAIVYGLAGALVLRDPVLASISLSLAFGILLCAAGGLRVIAGIAARSQEGAGWVIAAGCLTMMTGILVIAAWPSISLWLLGVFLTVDLIFQGWGFIALGLAVRRKKPVAA